MRELRASGWPHLFATGDGCWDIENFLRPAAEVVEAGEGVLVLSATQCSAESLQPELAGRRSSMRAIVKARIDRGVREGELPRGTDSNALTDFYSAVFQGMSLQAREGATRKRLLATAEAAMRAWPQRG